jgi:hypothetical protein
MDQCNEIQRRSRKSNLRVFGHIDNWYGLKISQAKDSSHDFGYYLVCTKPFQYLTLRC